MTSIKVKKIAISSLTISMLILVTGMCFGQNTQRQKGKRCCESKYEQNQLDSLNLVELGMEYHRLKSLNCQDCNNYGSSYQVIMTHLGEKLNGKRKKQVLKTMGKPDSKEEHKFMYFWRGRHDYLYFVFINS